MRKLILILLGVWLQTNLKAQADYQPPLLGLSAFIPKDGNELNMKDAFAFTGNQGNLARVEKFSVGVYGEQRFMISEVKNMHFAVSAPLGRGGVGFSASMFGTSEYGENRIGLAYGMRMGNHVDLGVQFNFNMMKIVMYGNASAITYAVAARVHLTSRLVAGLQLRNPAGGRFGEEKHEKFPTVFSFGLGYSPSSSFYVTCALNRDEQKAVGARVAVQYRLHEKINAAVGCDSQASSPWISLGYKLGGLWLEATASMHAQLGLSPGLKLNYSFGGSKKTEKEE